jgi:hypothetical protein
MLRFNLGEERQHATVKAIRNGYGPEARQERKVSRSL